MFDYNFWRDKVREKYSAHWALNDEAHREDHFHQVFVDGCEINRKLKLGYDESQIFIVAYFHDLFAWSRENHHELSQAFLRTTECEIVSELVGVVGHFDREVVADACFEHRASYKGVYTDKFSELMASADRGIINSVEERVEYVIKRSFSYAVSKCKKKGKKALEHVLEHAHEKFGAKGYQKLPGIYKRFHGELLDDCEVAFDKLTIEDVESVIK